MIEAIIEHIQNQGFAAYINPSNPDILRITKLGHEDCCGTGLCISTDAFAENSNVDHWIGLANTRMAFICIFIPPHAIPLVTVIEE